MFRVIGLLMLFSVIVLPVQAQSVEPACEIDELEGFFTVLDTTVLTIRQARMMADVDTILDVVLTLDAAVQGVKTACNPLNFTSEEFGQDAVIGPVSIGPGLYLATATTEGSLLVNTTADSGVCAPENLEVASVLFEFEAETATAGDEALFLSEGCTVVFDIGNATADWSVELVRIR